MRKGTEVTSRQLQAAQMRKKIFENTIKLYQTNDYESVTISDICKASEISTGNFYHYFKSKDDVLNEGFTRLNERFATQVDDLTLPPLEKIKYAFTVYLDSIEKNGYRFMSIFLHNEVLQQIAYENNPHRSVFTLLMDSLTEAFNSGILVNGDPATLFYDIYRLLKGTTFDWVVRHASFSLKDEFFRMLDQQLIPYTPLGR